MKHEVEDSLVGFEVDGGGSHAVARFHFAPELRVFAGHFPGMAIVPGVYLVEGGRLLAERTTGQRLEIAEILDARFTAEVHPPATVEAEATVERDGERVTCFVRFSSAGETAARIRMVLRPATPR